MCLGSDHWGCTEELRASMRAKLDEYDPPAGGNVDLPDVRRNFEAIGEGFYRILTTHAETVSESGQDAAFWTWVAAVTAYLSALGTWQRGVRQAVQNWAPTDAPGQQLKSAILAIAAPGSPPGPAPTGLAGRLK